METSERVDRVLCKQLGEGVDWSRDTPLREPIFNDGLSLDSLDMVELAILLEEEFGFDIPEDDFDSSDRIVTVGDVCDYIEQRLSAKPAMFA